MGDMNEDSTSVARVSLFLIAIVALLLILSIFSLLQAFEIYRRTGSPDLVTVTMSLGAIALSSYLLLQMRTRQIKLGFEMPKVFAMIQCSNCDFQQVREFKKGDYIFKQVEPCPKCQGKAYISLIYREPEEKED